MSLEPDAPGERRPWISLYPEGVPAQAVQQRQDVLSHFNAQLARRPDAVALWCLGLELTYQALDRRSDAIAAWLQSRGVRAGDRVCLLFQNSPEFVVLLLAAWKIGAVPTPCNPAYRSRELAGVFGDCEPAVVFCEAASLKEVREALDQADLAGTTTVPSRSRNAEGPVEADALWLEDLLEGSDPGGLKRAEPNGAGLGLLLYTSGTTGAPKGAMLRHASLAFNAEALAGWCALGEDSRILAIAPFFHITGLVCHIAAAFASGAQLILHHRFEPALVLDVIRRTRPTFTIGAITAFNALMNAPGAQADDLASFDRIYSGGAPIPPALAEAFRSKFGVPIHTSYGMTETSAPTHMAPYGAKIPVDPQSGAFAIGIPMPSTEAKCVDDAGALVPLGQTGELLLRGPQIMSGYYNKAEETAAALEGGWMHSGDIAFQDEAGWFYLVDRKKDVIIASGFKVWPREVEDVLYTHPAVREAAVVGAPDPYRGETVVAYVSLRDEAETSPEALIAHCRERLAAYKAPRSIEILDDLPKTVTGKIQRVALRTRHNPPQDKDAQ